MSTVKQAPYLGQRPLSETIKIFGVWRWGKETHSSLWFEVSTWKQLTFGLLAKVVISQRLLVDQPFKEQKNWRKPSGCLRILKSYVDLRQFPVKQSRPEGIPGAIWKWTASSLVGSLNPAKGRFEKQVGFGPNKIGSWALWWNGFHWLLGGQPNCGNFFVLNRKYQMPYSFGVARLNA